jgi:hypothetical protein
MALLPTLQPPVSNCLTYREPCHFQQCTCPINIALSCGSCTVLGLLYMGIQPFVQGTASLSGSGSGRPSQCNAFPRLAWWCLLGIWVDLSLCAQGPRWQHCIMMMMKASLPSRGGHTHTPAACAQPAWLSEVQRPGSCCSPSPTSLACSGRSPACMCPCLGSCSSTCSAVLTVLTVAHKTRLHWYSTNGGHVVSKPGGRVVLAAPGTASCLQQNQHPTVATKGCLVHHTTC